MVDEDHHQAKATEHVKPQVTRHPHGPIHGKV
jgi:hypothetical protein